MFKKVTLCVSDGMSNQAGWIQRLYPITDLLALIIRSFP